MLEPPRAPSTIGATIVFVACGAVAGLSGCRNVIGIEPLHASDGGANSVVDGGSTSDAGATDATSSLDAGCNIPEDPLRGAPGCAVIASDVANGADPLLFWGKIQCASPSLHEQVTTDGDPHVTAAGEAQGNAAYRKLTSLDGDARCDLGFDDLAGPTVFYREGDHRLTFLSARLSATSFAQSTRWQTVLQMESTYPNVSSQGARVAVQSFDGRWWLASGSDTLWSAPARAGVWTRFALDVVYSQDAKKGRVQLFVDLDGDGDSDSPNERSPVLTSATLGTEETGNTVFKIGDSVPSHLRAGINRHPDMSCPPPAGCHTDIDNVQVVRLEP